MNKLVLIDTASPIMADLARLALCERLQDMFNLHPGKMAKDILKAAKSQGRSPLTILPEFKERTLTILWWRFKEVQHLTQGGQEKLDHPKDNIVDQYFNLYPKELAKGLREKIEQIGIEKEKVNKSLFEAGVSLHDSVTKLTKWAFDEADRLIREGKIK